MGNDSRYFKLGLFVIVGLLLIVAGVVLFGAGALFREYVTMQTATKDSVQGLDVGSAVKYMGVPVGKISKIEMAMWHHQDADPAKQTEIQKYVVLELAIRRELVKARSGEEMQKNLNRAVGAGFRVRMASSGLTGPAFLELVYLDPQQHPVAELPWKPEHLFIPSTPSTMTQIVSSVEEVLAQLKRSQLDKVVANVDKLLVDTDKAVNDLQVATLRGKAADLLDEVRGTNKRVKEILDDPRVDKTIQDLSDAVAKGKEIAGGPEVKQLVEDLPKISGRMKETMARVDEIVHDPKVQKAIDGLSESASNAAPAVMELRRLLRQLDILMTTQRQDLESIVVNLRRVLENASTLVEDAKNNPSRAIFGSPPPRVQIGGSE